MTNNLESEEPQWSKTYILPQESEIDSKIEGLCYDIDELYKKLKEFENKKSEFKEYRYLLYEQGKPLEKAVIKAFKLMGFKAENYMDDDMEHDIILEDEEGKIIGEVEGKDNEAIKISKLDQLTRVVDEDFDRNGEYPQGMLIGNPYRLHDIVERKDSFSEKVIIAAKRKGFGLLCTAELFKACEKILQQPSDERLKKEFRKKIYNSMGKEIRF